MVTYLHDNELFLLHKYKPYFTLTETSSQRCARMHLNWLCCSVYRSGWVCPGSAGSQSRCTLTGILELQGAVPPISNPPWKHKIYSLAPEAPLFKRMPTGPKAFLELLGVSGLRPCAWIHLKKSLCYTRPVSGTNDKYRLSPCSQTWQFRRTLLSAVLTLIFCIYVLFILYTCSTYFLFFHVFFLAPNRPQHCWGGGEQMNSCFFQEYLSFKGNENNHFQDLNLGCLFHFLQW